MKISLIATAFLLFVSPTIAKAVDSDEAVERDGAPQRFSVLLTFGDEKCPEAQGDEIVVCATAPESDRYRIPKELREKPEEDMAGGSWANAVESMDEYARASRPDGCSVVGSNGFTGCTQAALRQWFAERRGKIAATREN